jgi:hypothetical protein
LTVIRGERALTKPGHRRRYVRINGFTIEYLARPTGGLIDAHTKLDPSELISFDGQLIDLWYLVLSSPVIEYAHRD